MTFIHVIRLALVAAMLLAFLHGMAIFLFLYSFYWWFDIPLHFLGGFCAGLVSLYFYSRFRLGNVRTRNFFGVLEFAILGTIVVGLGWELFEYSAGITFNAVGNHVLDTAKDLVMDILGGYVAYLYFIGKKFDKVHN